jgi:circadian clock protein KaiB
MRRYRGTLKHLKKTKSSTKEFEKAVARLGRGRYVLRLYVTGATPHSAKAVENLKKLCEEHLKGRYDLQVIDIYQQPTLAEGEQIIAVPTLIKQLPLPLRRFIGDMSDTEKILLGLDIREKKPSWRRRGREAVPEPEA